MQQLLIALIRRLTWAGQVELFSDAVHLRAGVQLIIEPVALAEARP